MFWLPRVALARSYSYYYCSYWSPAESPVLGVGRDVLAVDVAQLLGQQGRLEHARAVRVTGRALAPLVPNDREIQRLAPVAQVGLRLRAPALRPARLAVHRARARHAISVTHVRLAVAARVARRAHARPVGRVQYAAVLADVPQRLV